MFKAKLYLVIAILGLVALVAGACVQPTPSTPGSITAICTGTTVTVSNTGTTTITETLYFGDGTTVAITEDLSPGETDITDNPAPTTSGTIYGASTGAAAYSC